MSNTSLLGSYGGQAGDALMFRNRIINGDMRISQYGSVALVNNTIKYGGCDRTFVVPTGFTTVSGNATQSNFGDTTSGKGQFAAGLTTTGTGKIFFVQRIEAQNVNDLNNKYVTASGKIVHDLGTTQSVIVRIIRANALDSFATSTTVVQQTISVANSSTVSFSVTGLLGATDANNGLAIELEFNIGAVSSKNIGVGDLQLEAGPTATPFERRPYSVELALAQRYYEKIGGNGGDLYKFLAITCAISAVTSSMLIPYKVEKRTAGVTLYYSGSFGFLLPATITSFSIQGDGRSTSFFAGNVNGSGFTVGQSNVLRTNADANAYLAFDAEL